MQSHTRYLGVDGLTEDMARELCTITTRDEAGQHYAMWARHADALEALGLISVTRPTHHATGIPYSQEYWTVQITDDGQDVVDACPELHPE